MDLSYSLHTNSDEAWISDTKRRCVACDQIRDIRSFRMRGAPRNAQMVMSYCCVCVRKFARDEKQDKELAIQRSRVSAATQLAKVLSNTKKNLGPTCPDPIAVMESFVDQMGGEEQVGKLMAEGMKTVLEEGDPRTIAQGVGTIGRILLEAKRVDNAKPDFSQFTIDDQMQILEEPAKALLLHNDEFLQGALNDPEVRARILSHLGITTIEGTTVKLIEESEPQNGA